MTYHKDYMIVGRIYIITAIRETPEKADIDKDSSCKEVGLNPANCIVW